MRPCSSSGTLAGLFGGLAEAAYAQLDATAQAAARLLLLRLAETGEDGVLVRRRVPRAELGADAATAQALAMLINRRLVTAGDAGTEVTHEALLTHWPRLAGWLADDEQGRQLRRHLAPAAVEWENGGRPNDELYRGARLTGALDWAAAHLADLSETEQTFLAASRDHADRQLLDEIARGDQQARGRRRLRAALAGVVSLLLLVSAATIVAVDRQDAATQAGRQAEARRLGALALVTPDLDRSLLLAVQAVRTDESWETRGDLLAVLARSPQALGQVRGVDDGGILAQVTVTRDGSAVVADDGHGRMFTWDAATLAPIGTPVAAGQKAQALTPGPDPHAVYITVAIDVLKNTQAILYWDALTHQTLATFPLPTGVNGSTRHLTLTSDGRLLAVPTHGRALLLFDRATQSLRAQVPLPGPPGDVWPVGPLLVTAIADTATAVFIDPGAARIVRTLNLPFAGSVVPSPDARTLAVFAGDRAALVDLADGHLIRQLSTGSGAAAQAAFTGDGTLFAIASDDQITTVWDVASGELRDTLRGHSAPVRGLAFAPDGRTLFTVSRDNSIIAWDVTGDRSFATRHVRTPALPAAGATTGSALTQIADPAVYVSADHRHAYVAAGDGSAAALVDLDSGRKLHPVRPLPSDGSYFTVDVDHQIFYTSKDDGVQRSDLVTGALSPLIPVATGLIASDTALSADGRLLTTDMVTADDQPGGVQLLDTATMTATGPAFPVDYLPWTTWLNRDGSLLVASEFFGNRVDLWDTHTRQRLWQTDIGTPQGTAFALAPDGRSLAVGSRSGALVLLDTVTGRVLARKTGVSGSISSADFSPDGSLLAVSGNDGRTHLFEAANLHEVGQALISSGSGWAFTAYSSDGTHLSAVDERGRVVTWDARPPSWLARACAITRRDLTPAEWATFVPSTPYARTCTTALT